MINISPIFLTKLSDLEKSKITAAISHSEKFINKHFNYESIINVAFCEPSALSMPIPEDDVGGYAMNSSLIFICSADFNSLNQTILSEMICHEISHAIRYSACSEYAINTLDNCILEGLAIVTEELFSKETNEKQSFFLTSIQSDEKAKLPKILTRYRNISNNTNPSITQSFLFGDGNNSRWFGYTLGYHIVKNIMESRKYKLHKIHELSYEDFRDFFNKKHLS